MNKKVTIALCVKNAEKVVKTALDSISIQNYPHEFIKLVVVDDSSDNTLITVMDFTRRTDIKTFVTSGQGKGLGAARQVAVDNSEGDYIVWIDDDLVLPKNYIRNQIEFMEKNLNVGAARGVGIKNIPQAGIININEYSFLLNKYSQDPKSIGTVGAIFRLKALESIGRFDIRIKGAGEDQDISNRLRKSGWSLSTIKSARFYHKYPPATLKTLWKKLSWYGYGYHFIFHKYRNQRELTEYFPPFALWVGIKSSCLFYRETNLKKVFVYPVLHSFCMIAQNIGFIRAHLDGYGHIKKY